MAVPLKIPLLEVEWLVTVASRLPGHRGAGKLTRLKLFALKPAFARIVIAGNTGDVDIQIDRVARVGSQFAQLFAAVLCRVNAIAGGIDNGEIGNQIDFAGLFARGFVRERPIASAGMRRFPGPARDFPGMV